MFKLIVFQITRESGPGQRGEPGHAPGSGPDASGAQQSIEVSPQRRLKDTRARRKMNIIKENKARSDPIRKRYFFRGAVGADLYTDVRCCAEQEPAVSGPSAPCADRRPAVMLRHEVLPLTGRGRSRRGTDTEETLESTEHVPTIVLILL
ncbi:hypothetical protein F2P81_016450 [Scophthalmus maximus]|uniref:Uncharacterized protein n=1 Tax=Scophthalmus maximus TaxID=52904 RepID=A0A6A4SH09_SCOMX|nr:hypothetical protein F2P81_016450 [Scophthalmus maximus]